ncbi:MAG: hypothetical protein ACKV2V_06575 [Blastocatellia bacterium]
MIHHISMEADNPGHVAAVLAEMLGGQAVNAPPNFPAGSRFVLSGDQHGTMLEILPRGTELRPDREEAGFYLERARGRVYGGTHAYISVNASRERLLEIGAREGWLTRHCNRGPFELVECWVENRTLLELAPPAMRDQYLNLLTNPAAMQAALAELSGGRRD